MIDPTMIPDEVVEAMMQPLTYPMGTLPATIHRKRIAAALAAWPGAKIESFAWAHGPDYIYFPLPPEPPGTLVQYVTTADGQREAIYCEGAEPGDNPQEGWAMSERDEVLTVLWIGFAIGFSFNAMLVTGAVLMGFTTCR